MPIWTRWTLHLLDFIQARQLPMLQLLLQVSAKGALLGPCYVLPQ